jgi:hypothetical protein
MGLMGPIGPIGRMKRKAIAATVMVTERRGSQSPKRM